MYGTILVPFDGGEGASAALEHALELAATHDATVRVLYVIDTTTSPLVVSKDDVREGLREVGEEAAGRAFAEAEEMAREHGVEIETALREGEPAGGVLDAVADHDLVVMGTHGREGLPRRLLGSVAERVVRESPTPVLTVRGGA